MLCYFIVAFSLLSSSFAGNYVTSSEKTYGGAIYNNNTILEITSGQFIKNYAVSSSFNAYGGAIYNEKNIGAINADFVNNYVSAKSSYGGAVYNSSTGVIKSISGEFNYNSVNSESDIDTDAVEGGTDMGFSVIQVKDVTDKKEIKDIIDLIQGTLSSEIERKSASVSVST